MSKFNPIDDLKHFVQSVKLLKSTFYLVISNLVERLSKAKVILGFYTF